MAEATASAIAAGKYLTFNLGDEHYGLEILRVQEIVGLLAVTRVPRLPSHVAGVVNLRGRVIPVIDLRVAFGFEDSSVNDRTCIIVARILKDDGGEIVMGVIVDEVSDVVDLTADTMGETPEFGSEVDTSFIKGVGRIEDRVVLLLDIDKVLKATELEAVERAAATGAGEGMPQEEGEADA